MPTLTEADQQDLNNKGLMLEHVEAQLETFRKGIPYTVLNRPCTVNNGITRLSAQERDAYAQHFEDVALSGRVTKFVPASGAASRMFKTLLTTLEEYQNEVSPTSLRDLLSQTKNAKALGEFFQQLDAFAFHDDLQAQLASQGITATDQQWKAVLRTLLFTPGLNYANLPKGLLKFHRYSDHVRTPIEEHIVEGCAYAKDASGTVRIHFTISPDHEQLIFEHVADIRRRVENQNVKFDITCSQQLASTDTIAVDLENRPFRDSTGALVFRPGGHGALIHNLHNLQGDIVFIKNIDNVVPQRLIDQPNLYKKALGGYLVTIQRQLFHYVQALSKDAIEEQYFHEIAAFAEHTFGMTMSEKVKSQSVRYQQNVLFKQLNRPIRVCGMVPNTGEPGGGPFWVTHQDGSHSMQIVESSQVDPQVDSQQAILHTSTHFNPVDLVCGVRDYQGQPFDLPTFSNPEAGFIARKSYQGRDLKALELPGLWNGAMAKWNTLFVEVPISTFNPVKTVLDLLRPEHQATEPLRRHNQPQHNACP
ncbi:MAG: hypothetical protein NPIRA02_23750 [Nitrospirales bacterium]|nr:MAG: hypothetical protein NPIRA02_23750 [Nitrospirales bacterium]